MAKVLNRALADAYAERADELVAAGVPKRLAHRVAALPVLRRAADIVLVSAATGRKIEDIAEAFFRLGGELEIDRLLDSANDIVAPDYYDRLALNRALESITAAQRRLAIEALSGRAKKPLDRWLETHAAAIARARMMIGELVDSGSLTLSKLSVASAHMHDLATH